MYIGLRDSILFKRKYERIELINVCKYVKLCVRRACVSMCTYV